MRGRMPRWRCIVGAVATMLAVAALVAAFTWGAIFDSVLASNLALTPTSRSFQNWRAPSVPIYFEVFLYNWTNAEQFPHEKPNLAQIGPYRFREERSHVNITWNNHNGSIAYRTLRRFFFDPLTSNGTLKDNVTTLNVLAASAVYRTRYWSYVRQKGLSMGLSMFGQHISVTKTAGEILFDGYEDPLLDMAKSLPSSATGDAPRVDRFGWFYGRNNSLDSDGYVEVTNGQASGTFPGQILKWNHEDRLPFYSGKCSEVAGSAGEFLPRGMTEQSLLKMFVPDLCRTVNMEYIGNAENGGLKYLKYALKEKGFDYSPASPSESCFCDGQCPWSGVMNVSACRFNSPAFVTLPHFLHGDPRLLDMVTGMEPDAEKHEFFFGVEPQLGIPLEVAARFQINVYIEPNPNIALYESVPTMLFPVFWIQQRVQMNEEILHELKTVRAILDWGSTVCAGAAFALAVIVAMVTCCGTKPKYVPPHEMTFEKPKDEAELKLNPQYFES